MANLTVGQLADLATPDALDLAEAEKADGSASGKVTFADLVAAGLGSNDDIVAFLLDLAERHNRLVDWMIGLGMPISPEFKVPNVP